MYRPAKRIAFSFRPALVLFRSQDQRSTPIGLRIVNATLLHPTFRNPTLQVSLLKLFLVSKKPSYSWSLSVVDELSWINLREEAVQVLLSILRSVVPVRPSTSDSRVEQSEVSPAVGATPETRRHVGAQGPFSHLRIFDRLFCRDGPCFGGVFSMFGGGSKKPRGENPSSAMLKTSTGAGVRNEALPRTAESHPAPPARSPPVEKNPPPSMFLPVFKNDNVHPADRVNIHPNLVARTIDALAPILILPQEDEPVRALYSPFNPKMREEVFQEFVRLATEIVWPRSLEVALEEWPREEARRTEILRHIEAEARRGGEAEERGEEVTSTAEEAEAEEATSKDSETEEDREAEDAAEDLFDALGAVTDVLRLALANAHAEKRMAIPRLLVSELQQAWSDESEVQTLGVLGGGGTRRGDVGVGGDVGVAPGLAVCARRLGLVGLIAPRPDRLLHMYTAQVAGVVYSSSPVEDQRARTPEEPAVSSSPRNRCPRTLSTSSPDLFHNGYTEPDPAETDPRALAYQALANLGTTISSQPFDPIDLAMPPMGSRSAVKYFFEDFSGDLSTSLSNFGLGLGALGMMSGLGLGPQTSSKSKNFDCAAGLARETRMRALILESEFRVRTWEGLGSSNLVMLEERWVESIGGKHPTVFIPMPVDSTGSSIGAHRRDVLSGVVFSRGGTTTSKGHQHEARTAREGRSRDERGSAAIGVDGANLPTIQTASYEPYFERQVQAQCGRHALNNAIGLPLLDEESMTAACDYYLFELYTFYQEVENRNHHMTETGWYSIEVMATALLRADNLFALEPRRLGSFSAEEQEVLLISDSTAGLVMNVADEGHWVALRYIDTKIWLLDSQRQPREIGLGEYGDLLAAYPDTFVIRKM